MGNASECYAAQIHSIDREPVTEVAATPETVLGTAVQAETRVRMSVVRPRHSQCHNCVSERPRQLPRAEGAVAREWR